MPGILVGVPAIKRTNSNYALMKLMKNTEMVKYTVCQTMIGAIKNKGVKLLTGIVE